MFQAQLNLNALSVNRCWQGRRFKTKEYKVYEEEMMWLLPKKEFPKNNISLEIQVGFSSPLSDIDNVLKPLIDILQKRYDFNDREIKKITIEKFKVKKGEEFVKIIAIEKVEG